MKYTVDRFAYHLFLASVLLLIFGYGVSVGIFHFFPYFGILRTMKGAARGYIELCSRYDIGTIGKRLPWYYTPVRSPYPEAVRNTDQAHQGLNLVSRIAADNKLVVDVMDMDGKIVHQWNLDWFEIWPDAEHVHEKLRPKSRPGTHVPPVILMPNGDLVFSFEYLGLARVNPEGEVVWRLPYRTHHSIERDDDGNLWVCGQKEYTEPDDRFPNMIPPFVEDTILVVTPDGKITHEWSVPEILRKNDLQGLLYLGGLDLLVPTLGDATHLNGDVLHLNDAEPFPASRLKEGFFTKNDVLVSLRNVNTVLVFDRETEKVKFLCAGMFLRQHDPDFIDGNTFSVFDNNVTGPPNTYPQSRVTIVSAPDKTIKTFFEGTPVRPFFTIMLGKNQWLPNGNLLLVESCAGRAIEVDPDGEIVWEYRNYVDDGVVGLIDDVQRLPSEYSRLFNDPKSNSQEPGQSNPSPNTSTNTNTTGDETR